jgi:hypothetical protein
VRIGGIKEMGDKSSRYINRLYRDESEIEYKIAIAQIIYICLCEEKNLKSFL